MKNSAQKIRSQPAGGCQYLRASRRNSPPPWSAARLAGEEGGGAAQGRAVGDVVKRGRSIGLDCMAGRRILVGARYKWSRPADEPGLSTRR